MEVQQTKVFEPLWKTRLRLAWKGFKSNWRLFAENPVGMVGVVIIAFFALMALAYPIMINFVWEPRVYDPITGFDLEIAEHPSPPSLRHPLGTDPIGRDVLSQLMYGTGSEFMLGMIAALVTVLLATTVGAVSAYYGGVVDLITMRIADVILMLPFIPLLIVMTSLFDFQMIHLALLYGLMSGFGGTTIVIKSQALTIKVKPYIEAARVAGGSDWHIIFTHFVPNLMPLAFLYMMITVTNAIFAEAVLSFFGLLNIPMSWGIMIYTAQTTGYLLAGFKYWYLLIPSGLSITLLCSAFYLVGRAMDEIINPRLRER
jgi:peptide/nickel transport system permease protein